MENWPVLHDFEGYNITMQHKERSQNNIVYNILSHRFCHMDQRHGTWMMKVLSRLTEIHLLRE